MQGSNTNFNVVDKGFYYNKYLLRAPVFTWVEVQYKLGFLLLALCLQEYRTGLNSLLSLFSFFRYFRHDFHILSDWCPQRIFFGKISLPFNILFVFHILLFFPSFSVFFGLGLRELPTSSTIWPHLDILIGQKFSGSPQ